MITTEDLRSRHYHEPFEPFRIVMRDGREFPVEDRFFFSISPLGHEIVWAPKILDLEFIQIKDIAALPLLEVPAGAVNP